MNRKHLLVEPLEVRRLLTVAPEFVADLNTNIQDPETNSTNTSVLAPIGDKVFFFETEILDRHHSFGRPSLWALDAGGGDNTAKLVRTFESETWPSRCCSASILGEYAEQLVFQLRNSTGAELWISDGTVEGTRLLYATEGINNQFQLHDSDEQALYFRQTDADQQLWRTEGTRKTTSVVFDASQLRHVVDLKVAQGRKYLLVSKLPLFPFQVYELQDNAEAKRIFIGNAESHLKAIVDPLNNDLFVNTQIAGGKTEWSIVRDGESRAVNSLEEELLAGSSGGRNVVIGDWLYTVRNSTELWVTNGRDQSRQIEVDADVEKIDDLTRIGSQLTFTISSDSERWITDGTDEGTRIFGDLNSLSRPVTLGEKILFWNDDALNVVDLNGTVTSLIPPKGEFREDWLFTDGEHVYFRSKYARSGTSLYRTDGTTDGTEEVFQRYAWTQDSKFGEAFTLGDELFLPFEATTPSIRATNGTDLRAPLIPTDSKIVARFDQHIFFHQAQDGKDKLFLVDQVRTLDPGKPPLEIPVRLEALQVKGYPIFQLGGEFALITDLSRAN